MNAVPGLSFSVEAEAEFARIRNRYPDPRGAIVPALRLAQRHLGKWGDDACPRPDSVALAEVVAYVAARLGVPAAAVFGAATYYRELRSCDDGRPRVSVCSGLSCRLMGAERVIEQLQGRGDATDYTLETCLCLASCGTAPVMLLDGEIHESLTTKRIHQIMDATANRRPAQ